MYLKVSRKPINLWCKKGDESQDIKIGTSYSFYLVQSKREGKNIKQKTIISLGYYAKKEYEPVRVGRETVSSFGYVHSRTRIYVESFDVKDSKSFKKVEPKKPIRFFHNVARNFKRAMNECNVSEEKIKEFTEQILKEVPLYTLMDYVSYINEEIKAKIVSEVNSYYRDLDKFIHGFNYDILDYVRYKDGILQSRPNSLDIKVNYKVIESD